MAHSGKRPQQFPALQSRIKPAVDLHAAPSMVVTTRFGFTQHDFANFANGGGFDPSPLGFPPSLISQAPGKFFPGISFPNANYTGFGGSGNSHDTSTNWYVTSAASKLLNKHSLKFGG